MKTDEQRARNREAQRRYRKRNPDADRERYYRDVEKTRAQKRASDKRRWDANREALNARQRAYRAKDPERWREYGRQWRKDNKERHSAQVEAWRLANLDHIKQLDLAWRRANPAKVRDAIYRYREATANPSAPTVAYIEILFGDPCCYCGERGQAIDHIHARNHRGGHDWTNLTRACRRCNGSKGDKPLLLWLATRQADSSTPSRV